MYETQLNTQKIYVFMIRSELQYTSKETTNKKSASYNPDEVAI